ncbi:MAG TPA: SDR family oxidoreductase [Egibacteraceae bacterium]|nr:SDR family oxidoreductase [Egibacteraceae bacterium]
MADVDRAHHHARVALVTGANHGIGAATATALAAAGARVVAAHWPIRVPDGRGLPDEYARARSGGAEAVVEAIRRAGGQAHPVTADLADPDSASLLFDEAERIFGPVQILINNASSWLADTFTPAAADGLGRALEPVSADTFDRQFAVDAKASALLIAEFSRRHGARRADWGRIIGLTSGGALGFPDEVSYGAAKAAMESYTMSAAAELAGFGVTANVVHPPVTDTGWVTDDVRAWVEADRGHFSVAQPADVADVIAFLASDRARLITGNVIRMR